MRYTADENRNLKCAKGMNYDKDEATKIIVYNPSDNHRGEHDFLTIDSIKNMLEIAAKEPGYTVNATINGASFFVDNRMNFDEAWAAFENALNNVPPVEKDTEWERKEAERLAKIESLDTVELVSRLSEIYIPDVDYDNPDVVYVLKHLNDYKYDETKDVNENIILAFPRYPLREVVSMFKQVLKMAKTFGLNVEKICNRKYIMVIAKGVGVPERIPLAGRYGRVATLQKEAGRV